MTLGELIEELKRHDRNKIVPMGFHHPHSYRGYYDQLAFEPARNITVGEMLNCAQEALNTTYPGWKGGDFTMGSLRRFGLLMKAIVVKLLDRNY